MAFLIEDLDKHSLREGAKYLFDANVWLAVLDPNFGGNYTPPYVKIFNDIIAKNKVQTASIVVPSVLLSEILNRYLTDIYYKEFCIRNPRPANYSKPAHYKKVYRAHPDYRRDLNMACQEILTYAPTATLITDEIETYSISQLLTNVPMSLDFNDYLYTQIARSRNLFLVTGDADFCVEDVCILTKHPALLKLSKR